MRFSSSKKVAQRINPEREQFHENAATWLLKWGTLLCFGMGCQRVALAMPADIPLSGEMAKLGLAAGAAKAAANFAQEDPSPARLNAADNKLAQADYTGGAILDDITSSPQAIPQESINTDRQPSISHRRRRPRMAGVPPGLQTAEPPPEPDTAQILSSGQQVEKTGISIKVPMESPAASQAVSKSRLSEVAEEVELAPETDNLETPGEIARRKAVKAQGLVARKYRLAPIKWGGTITETAGFRRTTTLASAGGSVLNPTATSRLDTQSIYHIQTVMVGAETYVMQPWIATVRGRVGVLTGTQGIPQSTNNDQRKTSWFGGGDLALFNRSRFPSVVKLDVTDNRDTMNTADSVDTSNIVSKKLSMNQLYRHPDEITNYDVTLERENTTYQSLASFYAGRAAIDSTSTSQSNVTRLFGDYSTKLGRKHDQPFYVNVSHSNFANSVPGQSSMSSRADFIGARHTYMPDDSLLTLNSYANLFSSSQVGNTSRSLLAGSRATWQPESEEIPLVVRGGGQIFTAHNDNGLALNKTQSLSGDVAFNYGAWVDRRLSGGGTLARTTSGGVTSFSTTQYARGDYYPGVIRFGTANYSRYFDVGFNRQTYNYYGSNNLSIYGDASHTLNNRYSFNLFGYNSTITPSVGQSLNARTDQINGNSETLRHNASVVWSPSLTKRYRGDRINKGEVRESSDGNAGLRGLLGVNGYDVRVFGRTPSHTRTLALTAGLTGLGNYAARASGYGASGDLTVNAIYQGNQKSVDATANARWGTQYNYNYKINKPSFLGVKGLNYFLTLNAYANTNVAALRRQAMASGNSTAASNNAALTSSGYGVGYSVLLNQGLRYRIGQNEALVTATLADNYGIKTTSLFLQFRAWRNFGN
jgi:hypothetical protein